MLCGTSYSQSVANTVLAANKTDKIKSTAYYFDVPRVSSSVGSRVFSVAGPQAWNRLPAALRHTDRVASFKRQLKTVLFVCVNKQF